VTNSLMPVELAESILTDIAAWETDVKSQRR
jgi:hypothetical protein